MNPLIIIQARMGSTRFPGKVLAPLDGDPLISHILEACVQVGAPAVVACPVGNANCPLFAYLDSIEVEWDAAAEESDVLGRFAAVALNRPEHDVIVRLTADCPLVDYRTIDQMLEHLEMSGAKYVGVTNAPDGNDVEVFTRDHLLMANELTVNGREHVTTWMRHQPDALMPVPAGDWSDVKYSVDTPEDLAVCAELIDRCGSGSTWNEYVHAFRAMTATRINGADL